MAFLYSATFASAEAALASAACLFRTSLLGTICSVPIKLVSSFLGAAALGLEAALVPIKLVSSFTGS